MYIIFCFLAGFNLIGQMDKSSKAHSRIIWSCTWTHDDAFFATGARDKRVKERGRRGKGRGREGEMD